jgi:arginine decarboxylase
MTNWSSKDSLKVYNVPYWGAGFSISMTPVM